MVEQDFFKGTAGRKTRLLKEGVWPGASGWTSVIARKIRAKLFPSKPLITEVPVSSEEKTTKSLAYTRLLGRIQSVELGETRFTSVMKEICAANRRGLLLDGEVKDLHTHLREAVAASKTDGVYGPLHETIDNIQNGNGASNSRRTGNRQKVFRKDSVQAQPNGQNGHHNGKVYPETVTDARKTFFPVPVGSIPGTNGSFGTRIAFVRGRAPVDKGRVRATR